MQKKHMIEVENDEMVSTIHHTQDSGKWMFFCHGFGSGKDGSYERRCKRVVNKGYNAVRFDFRGNGESDGEFINQTLSSRIRDLKSVVNYFNPDSYILFGSSFGGKTAFHSAITDERVEAVIGRAPVTYNRIYDERRSIVDKKGSFKHHSGKVIDERFFEDFDKHPFKQVEQNLDIPVAIFQGELDEFVPMINSFEAARNLSTDVLLQKYAMEEHDFSSSTEESMFAQMCDWLRLNGI